MSIFSACVFFVASVRAEVPVASPVDFSIYDVVDFRTDRAELVEGVLGECSQHRGGICFCSQPELSPVNQCQDFYELVRLATMHRPVSQVYRVPSYVRPCALVVSAYCFADGVILPDREQDRLSARLATMADKAIVVRLKNIFKSEGVPDQWVWLAEVESAMNPKARSSMGAVGLFQLMPDTAHRFGLQTFPVDERKVPEKNARAAAQYLRTLYRQFGCWSLALAAFNAGEGRVIRTMKKYGVSSFAEVLRHLPSETQSYVPRVMAVASMREDELRSVSVTSYP